MAVQHIHAQTGRDRDDADRRHEQRFPVFIDVLFLILALCPEIDGKGAGDIRQAQHQYREAGNADHKGALVVEAPPAGKQQEQHIRQYDTGQRELQSPAPSIPAQAQQHANQTCGVKQYGHAQRQALGAAARQRAGCLDQVVPGGSGG